MSVESLQLEVNTLKLQMAELLSKSKQPKDGTETTIADPAGLVMIQNPSQNVEFIQFLTFAKILLESIGMIDVDNDPAIGAFSFGIKTGINNGKFWMGYIQLVSPPTSNAHVNFTYKLA